jgi:hypothetical protein
MDSTAFCHGRNTYCHNGGMASHAIHGVGLPGSIMTIMAPSGGSLKTAGLQGKSRKVGVPRPWGQRWPRLPPDPLDE